MFSRKMSDMVARCILFCLCIVPYSFTYTMESVDKNTPFLFLSLPTDQQKCVWDYLTIHSFGSRIVITKTLNSFAQVNKKYNTLLNDSSFCKNLIKNLSKNFQCSYEEVVEGLQTKEAKKILAMQNIAFALCTPQAINTVQFFTGEHGFSKDEFIRAHQSNRLYRDKKFLGVCLTPNDIREIVKNGVGLDHCLQVHKLKQLCQYDIDLEFSYNRPTYVKNVTPFLALCSSKITEYYSGSKDSIYPFINFFIDEHKKGHVDINLADSEGMTIFMHACSGTLSKLIFNCFCKNLSLVNINQQDAKGNTALMHYICSFVDTYRLEMVEELRLFIIAGADPTLGNYAGLTPLVRLEHLYQNGNFMTQRTFSQGLGYLRSVIEQ